MTRFVGNALEPHTESRGRSGYTKIYPEDELRKSTDSLKGCPVAGTSGWDATDIIGQVTDAWYEDGVGVKFECKILDEECAQKLEQGIIDIAPRLIHDTVDYEGEDAVHTATDIEFEGLFLCPAACDNVPGLGGWTVINR